MKRASSNPRSKAQIMLVSKILAIQYVVLWWLSIDLPDSLANIDCLEIWYQTKGLLKSFPVL